MAFGQRKIIISLADPRADYIVPGSGSETSDVPMQNARKPANVWTHLPRRVPLGRAAGPAVAAYCLQWERLCWGCLRRSILPSAWSAPDCSGLLRGWEGRWTQEAPQPYAARRSGRSPR
eukprot:5743847-Pyramimonas_sp.AAC.2